jgi:hypothetical protein
MFIFSATATPITAATNNNNNNNNNNNTQYRPISYKKTAILGTSHIIRKVLQAETWSLSGGVHHWLKRRSTREERKPVTRDNNNNNQYTALCGWLSRSP